MKDYVKKVSHGLEAQKEHTNPVLKILPDNIIMPTFNHGQTGRQTMIRKK